MNGFSGLRLLLVITLLATLSLAVNGFVLFENVADFNVQMETKINVQTKVTIVTFPLEEVSAIEIVGLSTQDLGLVNNMKVDADREAGNLLFSNWDLGDVPFYLLE